ncbi:MAG TPA: NAAT family transporter [Saprospiraceae bacterium]|nr:NAAT family transporter [Saprospiraceae bacterium]
MNFKEIISVFLILFSVIDILGSIPIIIEMKKKGTTIGSFQATLVAFVLMTIFLFAGEGLLRLFGVDVESFAVAGAIIIFLMGFEMIVGVQIFKEEMKGASGSIVPIAFPLIAGAGTLTTILTLRAKYQAINIEAAIFLNMLVVYVVLKGSTWISQRLGRSGANVLRKVFGIILLAIATKLFRDNFHLVVKVTAE